MALNFAIELEQEEDGPWIAEVPDLPGVLPYGATRQAAIAAVEVLAGGRAEDAGANRQAVRAQV